MPFVRPFLDDDPSTRQFMLTEFDSDKAAGRDYPSKYRSPEGQQAWLPMLRSAIESYDDVWLANEVRGDRHWLETYPRRKPKGGYTDALVPVTAPETFAEGEFQRYYLRGLCLRAIESGRGLVAARDKEVAKPREESRRIEGHFIDPQALLDDLRNNIGIDTHLGLPAGPNSGMSARLA